MKPLSYVYSYIPMPVNEWNDLNIDIWLYNALKYTGIAALESRTHLIEIKNHRACVCEEFEYIQKVAIREDITKEQLMDYPVVDGSIMIPEGSYPVVQQTVNNQVSAIYPLLPKWFPWANNDWQVTEYWFVANPKEVPFSKVCKECPTTCSDCEYYYNLDMDGCLYFPQVENGVACVSTKSIPEKENILIDDTNQYLLDYLANYVMWQHWLIKSQMDRDNFSIKMVAMFEDSARKGLNKARAKRMFQVADFDKIKVIMNPDMKGMLNSLQQP